MLGPNEELSQHYLALPYGARSHRGSCVTYVRRNAGLRLVGEQEVAGERMRVKRGRGRGREPVF